jgi:hypothetical protein
MSPSHDWIDDLAARARMEGPPQVDVASRVVFRLSRKTRRPVWPLVFVASGLTACAAIVFAVALPLVEMLADPWSAVFMAAANVLR